MRQITIFIVTTFAVFSGTAVQASILAYVESGGQVVGEGETFSSRSSNPGQIAWVVRPGENSGTTAEDGGPIVNNARGGSYIQSLPDENSVGGGGPLNLPEVTYKMVIETTGTYQLYVRWDGNDTDSGTRGRSDSLFADIVEFKDGSGGAIADWYELTQKVNGSFANPAWDGGGEAEANAANANDNPMTWDITIPGVYTLRFTAREDGSAVDAWVFQRNTLSAPTGNGPTTSATALIPEPSTYAVFAGLAFCFGAAGWWRKRRQAAG